MTTADILSRAKAHFDAQRGKTVTVPEWGEPGEPLVIHYDPPNMRERRKIFAKAAANDLSAMVDAIIMMAKDRNGEKMFGEGDRHALMTEVDSVVVMRIGQAMVEAAEFTAETAAKN